MLSHASNCPSTAIADYNMVEIKVANELLHSAQQGYKKASLHREELRKAHVSIGSKWRKAMTQLVKEVKRSKTGTKFKKLISGNFFSDILGLFCCYFVI